MMIPQPINCYYTLKEIEAKKDYNVISVDGQFIHANAFIYNTNTTDALEFNTSQALNKFKFLHVSLLCSIFFYVST